MQLSVATIGAALAVLLHGAAAASAPGDVRSNQPSAAQPSSAEPTPPPKQQLAFLEAGLGGMYVDTLALKDAELLDPYRWQTSGFGSTWSVALGVRARQFSIAATYREGNFADWQLWTLGAEASMHFPLGRLEPYFGLGVAHASIAGLSADVSHAPYFAMAPAIDIHGLDLRVNVGASYHVVPWFSVGANLSGDAFFLSRKGDHLIRTSSTDPNARPTWVYATDGSGNGLGMGLSLVLGLHY